MYPKNLVVEISTDGPDFTQGYPVAVEAMDKYLRQLRAGLLMVQPSGTFFDSTGEVVGTWTWENGDPVAQWERELLASGTPVVDASAMYAEEPVPEDDYADGELVDEFTAPNLVVNIETVNILFATETVRPVDVSRRGMFRR